MKFGERLKKLREQHSISGYKLGILTERPRQFVSNIENGHRPPPDDFLKKLSEVDVLEITYDELKAWALEDKYTRAQIDLARKNFLSLSCSSEFGVPVVQNLNLNSLTDNSSIDQNLIVDWVYYKNNVSNKALGIIISDNALYPKIETGDTVVIERIDGSKTLKNNHIYIFQTPKNNFCARILHSNKSKKYLYPLTFKGYSIEDLDTTKLLLVGIPIKIIKSSNFYITEDEIRSISQKPTTY